MSTWSSKLTPLWLLALFFGILFFRNVLRKGFTFVPTTRYDNFGWITDISLFIRRLKWEIFFNKKKRRDCQSYGLEQEVWEGLEALEGLLEEGNREPREGPMQKKVLDLHHKKCTHV